MERVHPESKTLPREEWGPYFNELTRRLRDGRDPEATLALVSDEAAGTEAEALPLDSISFERGDDQIAIGLGGRGARYPVVLWHFVDKPRMVWFSDDENDGIPDLVVIASDDGTVTRLDAR